MIWLENETSGFLMNFVAIPHFDIPATSAIQPAPTAYSAIAMFSRVLAWDGIKPYPWAVYTIYVGTIEKLQRNTLGDEQEVNPDIFSPIVIAPVRPWLPYVFPPVGTPPEERPWSMTVGNNPVSADFSVQNKISANSLGIEITLTLTEFLPLKLKHIREWGD